MELCDDVVWRDGSIVLVCEQQAGHEGPHLEPQVIDEGRDESGHRQVNISWTEV